MRRFWNAFSKVPPRLKREHLDEELYCLALYLRALSSTRLLKYPILIKAAENSKSPDFILTSSRQTIGIEVTRATTPEFQRSMTSQEKQFERTGKTTATLLSANGWAGNDAEKQWCRFIQEAIEKKERLLGKYEPANQYELLIYDDAPLPTIDRSFVIPRLKSWLQGRNGGRSFATISVILSLDVLHDLGGTARSIPFVTGNPGTVRNFSRREKQFEKAAALAASASIEFRLPSTAAVYSVEDNGRLMKELADGRRFEVQLAENGEETIVAEVPRA